jgi:phosphoribosylanthranilate isomerase
MNIKICGITDLKQLQQLDGLDIDFAGLIFYPASPRYVGDKLSKSDVKKADFDLNVLDAIDDYGLEVVQLHGDESAQMCEDLSTEVEVIKAFRITGDENIDELVAPYDAVCDYYLFDTGGASSSLGGSAAPSFGGTGKQFDWSKLNKAKIEKPFFLSGGIGVEDIARIKAFKHLDLFGIDVNSKFETAPGVKDMSKVLQLKMGMK